jgi:hypothetical protein
MEDRTRSRNGPSGPGVGASEVEPNRGVGAIGKMISRVVNPTPCPSGLRVLCTASHGFLRNA